MNKEQLADFTQAEFDEKYAEIFTDRTSNKQPADNPYACVLGGQPGAGKTTIHGIIGTNYPDIVIINADDFRQYHPRYKELQAQYGADDVKYTQPFINAITEKLIADLSDKKYHLGIEGTLRTSEVPRNTCNALKSKGYSVELAVMAIDETVSWQGTLDRAEKTKLKNEIPRYTPKEHHDKVVATLPDNLETLYQDKCFDRIWLVNRQSEILYDTDRTPNLSPKPLIEAVLHETERNIQQNIPVNDYPPPDYELPPPPPEEPYYPEPSNNFQQNVTSNPDYRAYTELCNKNSIDISELSAVVSQLSKMSEQLAKSQKQVAEMQQQLDSVQKHSAFKPLVQSIKTIGTVIFAPVTVPAYLLKNAEKIITDGAKNAVENFGKLGVKALNFTANLLKIKPIVTAIGKQAKKEFTASDKIINNIENFSKAYHGVGAGFRNMGRALTGKEAVAPKEAGKLARALETPFKKHSEITKKIYSKCRNLYKALDTLEKAVEKPKEQKQQYTFTVDNLGKIEDKNEIKEPPKDRNKDIKKDTDERSERDD